MLNSSTTGFVAHFLRRYAARSFLLIILLVLSGISEGIGVVAMLPLLELAMNPDASSTTPVGTQVNEFFQGIGVTPGLEVLLLVIVGAMVLKGAFRLVAMKQVGYTVSRVATDLRLTLIRTLLETRWSYYTSQPVGRLTNALSSEANRASAAYKSAVTMLASLIQVLIYAGIAFWVSWQIALLAIAGGGLAVLALSRLVDLSRVAARAQARQMRSLTAMFADALHGIKPIKAMGREEHLQPLLEKETRAINRSQERQVIAAEAVTAAQEPILVTMMAVVLYVALTLGTQSFASVLVMAFVFYRLAGRIGTVQLNYQTVTTGETFFWSLQESIDAAVAQREPRIGTQSATLDREILFDGVDFSYGTRQVLRSATMSIPAGSFVALVGPSGAGKTTIADLVVRLQQPQAGRILVDGTPLDEIDLEAWRHAIGYVPQELFLFHDTVLSNITLGDPAITREDARDALVAAGAWAFVEGLDDGLDTVLGERGSRISGGQRQRVAIARALASHPKLLVLDEVTTALDPRTEAAICETLANLKGSVTILSISHQPAMMEAADILYKMVDGTTQMVERATHRRSAAATPAV